MGPYLHIAHSGRRRGTDSLEFEVRRGVPPSRRMKDQQERREGSDLLAPPSFSALPFGLPVLHCRKWSGKTLRISGLTPSPAQVQGWDTGLRHNSSQTG